MMSSWTSAAVWNTSIAHAMSTMALRVAGEPPNASYAARASSARRRLPPSLEVIP